MSGTGTLPIGPRIELRAGRTRTAKAAWRELWPSYHWSLSRCRLWRPCCSSLAPSPSSLSLLLSAIENAKREPVLPIHLLPFFPDSHPYCGELKAFPPSLAPVPLQISHFPPPPLPLLLTDALIWCYGAQVSFITNTDILSWGVVEFVQVSARSPSILFAFSAVSTRTCAYVQGNEWAA